MDSSPSRPGRLVAVAAIALLCLGAGFAIGLTTAADDGDTTATAAPATDPSTGPDDGRPTVTLPATDVDIGFLQDMIDHHEQIIRIADFAVANAEDPLVRAVAYGIVVDQRREVGLMEAYLTDRGQRRGAPDRTVMAWMHEPVPFEYMSGLVPQDELVAYLNASGPEVDRRFIDAAISHHQGGVHMAEYAADHTSDPAIRKLAAAMVVKQRQEIGDLEHMRDAHAAPGPTSGTPAS